MSSLWCVLLSADLRAALSIFVLVRLQLLGHSVCLHCQLRLVQGARAPQPTAEECHLLSPGAGGPEAKAKERALNSSDWPDGWTHKPMTELVHE